MKKTKFLTASFLFLFLAGVCSTQAAPKTTTWTGAGQNWNEAFWDNGIPADGDNVVINGNVVLTNSTPFLNSYTNNAGMTHTFGGTNTILIATNVTISGTMTHYAQTDTNGAPGVYSDWTPDNRIYIVCSNLTVDSSGRIDVQAKGYGSDPITPFHGYGPGGATSFEGGSYGGAGDKAANSASGYLYGSTNAPEDPGSGGGGYFTGYAGRPGGGAIRINASGTVLVNGTINADGGISDYAHGAGSGGSVYIVCRVFDGLNGTVSAKGGDSPAIGGWYGGGGGGRIAIIYDPLAQVSIPAVSLSAAPGSDGATYGDIGTLYFPDNLFLTPTLTYFGQWIVPGFTNWVTNNLTVSNGWIRFPSDGFQLTVTNRITVVGTDVKMHKLDLSSAVVMTCGENIVLTNAALILHSSERAGLTVSCGGNLSLADGAKFLVYSGPTNDVRPSYGALVSVAGDITITNAWIYPYSHLTNGGSALFRARNLTISGTNGGFDATGNGYQAGLGPGAGGSGPSAGGGGGYGGMGGTTALGGQTYGSSNAPVDAGSGGGTISGFAATVFGGNGGGSVRIQVVQTFLHNGSIFANGQDMASTWGSGGSGGGVYITCKSFAGTDGVIAANGGQGTTVSSGGGGGGGGRIAVWSIRNTFTGTLTAPTGGTTVMDPSFYGQPGTLVLGQLPPPGAIFYTY